MLAIWARVAVGTALLTLLVPDRALVLWAWALVAAWGLGGLLLGRVVGGLAVSQALSVSEAFVGETVTVHVRLTNRSVFPLPWVRVAQVLPRALERRSPRWLAALPPRSSFQAAYHLRLPRRGVYRIGRVGIEAGDWFGLWRTEGRVEVPLWLTVFPRPLSPTPPPPPPRLPEGERPRRASPIRAWEPAGLREYRRGDPLRLVAWRATARRGDLVVRLLPPVQDRVQVVVLDLRPSRWPAAHGAAWQERAVSLAAGYVAAAAARDEPLGLVLTGYAVRREPEADGPEVRRRDAPARGVGHAALLGRPAARALPPRPAVPALSALRAEPLPSGPVRIALPPRRGADHRRQVLRALAVVEPAEDAGFTPEALRALRRLASRASVLWIAGVADDESLGAAATACRSGHAVSVVFADLRRPVPAVPTAGVSLWPLPPGEGEEWL